MFATTSKILVIIILSAKLRGLPVSKQFFNHITNNDSLFLAIFNCSIIPCVSRIVAFKVKNINMISFCLYHN